MRIRFTFCIPFPSASKLESQDELVGFPHRSGFKLEAENRSYFGSSHSGLPLRPEGASPAGSTKLSGPQASVTKPYGWIVGRLHGKRIVTAKSIVASRTTMPAAPSFDPLPFMDEKTASVFQHLCTTFCNSLVMLSLQGPW